MCVTNEKDTVQQRQIWSTFVTVLECSKTEITDGTGILVLVRVLWDMISKIHWQFLHSFFKNALESSCNFNPIEIMWRKLVCSMCLKSVPMATWRLHTLWRFTVPAYYHSISLYDHTIQIDELCNGINWLKYKPNFVCCDIIT